MITKEQLQTATHEEIETQIDELFEENYQRLKSEGGHGLTPLVREQALNQVKAYYRKLREVAEAVTETEVRLTLPQQQTAAGRKYTVEGVVDIVSDEDRTVMYDIKTHEADYVRQNLEMYEKQLNVYAHIWRKLRQKPLDETAVIATAFPPRVLDAQRQGNETAAEREMEKWDPIVPIPIEPGKVEETIADFGKIVDLIEEKRFGPPAVEKLMEIVGDTRQKFGTRVCRNCDARFSCGSYRNFATATNARTGVNFRAYYADFGSGDDRAELIAATLDVAPPPENEEL